MRDMSLIIIQQGGERTFEYKEGKLIKQQFKPY